MFNKWEEVRLPITDGSPAPAGSDGDRMEFDDQAYISRDGHWRLMWKTVSAKPVSLADLINRPLVVADPPLKSITGTVSESHPSYAGNATYAKLPATLPESVFSPPKGEVTYNDCPFGGCYGCRELGITEHRVLWHEDNTVLGILRSLREESAKRTPSKPLVDAVEHATIALRQFNDALGDIEQDGWSEDNKLHEAELYLADECTNAVREDVRFATVAGPCQRAISKVLEAVAWLDKAAAR